MNTTQTRPIGTIARDISKHWPKVWFGAVPYLKAMRDIYSINDMYGADDARSIIRYFLSNAATWHGADARRIKAELNEMLK